MGHTPCRQGCHRRMGDYVLSGRALTIDELLVIQVLREEGWIEMEEEGNREAPLHLSMFAVVLTIGFAGAFMEKISQSLTWVRRVSTSKNVC